MPRSIIYDQPYIRKCFDAWYLNGRPNTPTGIKRILPPHSSGRIPSVTLINRWIIEGAWDMWADELDARAAIIADDNLVNQRAQMLKEHQEQAKQVTSKALDYLLQDDGFDSSSSAVQAFFKGLEEQRKTAGFSDLLEKLDKMTNNQVEQEIIDKLRRIQENDQIIEVEPGEVPELEEGE